jgi:hypothetical protein
VDEARRKLEAAKINVIKVEPYDPGAGLDNLIEFTSAPLRLEEGTQIKLITRDNKVLFYARMETESRQIRDLRAEVVAASAAIAEHKTALAEAAQLRSEKTDYRSHCRGDVCPNFAPATLIEIKRPLTILAPPVEPPPSTVEPPPSTCHHSLTYTLAQGCEPGSI